MLLIRTGRCMIHRSLFNFIFMTIWILDVIYNIMLGWFKGVLFYSIVFNSFIFILYLVMVKWIEKDVTYQNVSKRTYNARILCLCALDCWWLTDTTVWYHTILWVSVSRYVFIFRVVNAPAQASCGHAV
jgi:hypothetical protein